jgi:hypothetical protein
MIEYGSTWANIPAASSPNYWTLSSANILTALGIPNGIEADRFTSKAASTLANPLINSISGTSTFLRYGHPTATTAVFQESTTGFGLGTSSINWRYVNDENPQVITNLFGYVGSTSTLP